MNKINISEKYYNPQYTIPLSLNKFNYETVVVNISCLIL